ncbi:MAG: hypothetical protein JWL97_4452 [Gemmatimonadales bacterium]|nr:hypothetical protein [Gemmatimonadales bacterium]
MGDQLGDDREAHPEITRSEVPPLYSNLTGLSDTQQDTVRSDSHSRLGECLILGNVPIIHTEEVTG